MHYGERRAARLGAAARPGDERYLPGLLLCRMAGRHGVHCPRVVRLGESEFNANMARVTRSMMNATWACFDCREAVRRPHYWLKRIPCPKCGHAMGYLGFRIRIPAKRQANEWRKLSKMITGPDGSLTRARDRQRLQMMTELQNEIARLEATPKNKTRDASIRRHRKQLATLIKWSNELNE